MEHTEFCFRLEPLEVQALLPQLSRALEQRTERLSRERFPGLWRVTDRLQGSGGSARRSRGRSRFLSILCIALGIFLFVPGLVRPAELLGPLLMGAVALGAGIGGLWRGRKRREDPFRRSARLLLEGGGRNTARQGLELRFGEAGMLLPEGETVPCSAFECVLETRDLWLLVWAEQAAVLQKCELPAGEAEAFRSFLSERVAQYRQLPEAD